MTDMMKIAPIIGVKQIEIREVEKPIPKRGEVLVKVKACAICTWEQRLYLGVSKIPLPFVGGHEASGVIEALGEGVDDTEYQVGQKVALRLLDTCGKCYYCRQGRENLCVEIGKPNRFEKKAVPGPGGFGEYLVVSEKQVFKLPEDIPYSHGAFAEPLACVVNSIEKARIELGNDVVVVGAGIMGLLHTILSKKQGARVIVSEVDAHRRRVAEELGADITFNPLEVNPIEKVKDLTEGRGADVVFHTTAIPEVAQQAVQMAGKLGRVIMYGSFHPDAPISLSPNWIHNSEVEIKGAVSPSIENFQKSVRLLSHKTVNPAALVSEEYPLTEIEKAFQQAVKPDTFRIIVTNQ
ncbi:putative zinc-type alcohol dehydrogenase-like protein YjmD [Koleobacter methoxysyntrophicus]|uniref:Putative zinc-type alcohol dehydrogenase-like protein YjmD n=1 Tax=Koleobacter methoxysyntrophicus TaxID=2751313 RepID=A0A8A0RIM6_9FIRM|nr:alcohol dehydrogenase catalytic domain-containing protein [Koleobacter methoxysyntrophicus]QSQ08073.1 putative zinc-type alcohol dehydrogenase-like protein YjmD [Koleobacter methoxysyntrophicus]